MKQIKMGNFADHQLIPGLPHDIALDCLIRVPLGSHSDMKLVCHSWRDLISNPYFYQQRRKFEKSEHLVFLVQSTAAPSAAIAVAKSAPQPPPRVAQQVSVFNGTNHSWHKLKLTDVTIPLFSHCVTLPSLNKVLILGGWDPISFEPVPYPYIVDLINGDCKRGAPMLNPRSFFACGVVGPSSSVYVAGGHDKQKNALKSAEVYDVAADEWRMLPEMAEERDECHGLSWDGGDGRFWVVSGYGTENQGKFRSDAEYFEISTGRWSKVDGVWPFEDISPRGGTTTMCGGQWWWIFDDRLEHQSGAVKEFDDKEMKWKVVGSIKLPDSIIIGNKSQPCVSNFGDDKVFVMNGCDESVDWQRGLVIMDKDRGGSGGGINVGAPVGFSGFPYSASYILV